MERFSGRYYYSLDPKGRLMIPAQFRDILVRHFSEALYLTTAPLDQCLRIYPAQEWEKHLARLDAIEEMTPELLTYMRDVVSSAVPVEMDKQGRVLVPASLREDALLNGEIVILGQLSRIEVWSRELWKQAVDRTKIDQRAYISALGKHKLL